MKKKTKFYVIEGVDACGKTTICHELSKLNNWKYICTPTGFFKKQINEIEKLGDKPLAFSYFLSAVLNTSYLIKKDKYMKTIICDRYYPTLKVYYNAINFSQDFINLKNIPIVKPDKIIHIYVDYKKIKERLKHKKLLSVDELKLIKNKKFFDRLVEEYRKECDIEIDATNLLVNEIVEKIQTILFFKNLITK
jgi:thymidylate kinase